MSYACLETKFWTVKQNTRRIPLYIICHWYWIKIHISTCIIWSASFPIHLPALIVVIYLFIFCQSNAWKIKLHFSLIFVFLISRDPFICLLVICISSFMTFLFMSFVHFLQSTLCFPKSSLHVRILSLWVPRLLLLSYLPYFSQI